MGTFDDLYASGNDQDEMAKRKSMISPQGDDDEYIDRFEGDTAVLIKKSNDGYTTRDVSRSALPRGAKAGDVIPSSDIQDEDKKASIINSLYGSVFSR